MDLIKLDYYREITKLSFADLTMADFVSLKANVHLHMAKPS